MEVWHRYREEKGRDVLLYPRPRPYRGTNSRNANSCVANIVKKTEVRKALGAGALHPLLRS